MMNRNMVTAVMEARTAGSKIYITSLRRRVDKEEVFYNFGRTAPCWMDCCLCQFFSSPKSVIGVCLYAEGKDPMVGFLPPAGNSLGTSFTAPCPPLAQD